MTATDTPTPATQAAWPRGCSSPNGCERRKSCGYLGCTHMDRDIAPEIDAAVRAEVEKEAGR